MKQDDPMTRAIAVAKGEEISYSDLHKLFKELGWTTPRGENGRGSPRKSVLLDMLKGSINVLSPEELGNPEQEETVNPEPPKAEAVETLTPSPAGDEIPNWHQRRKIKI